MDFHFKSKSILMQTIGLMIYYSISSSAEVILDYSELVNLNASCAPVDACVDKKNEKVKIPDHNSKRCDCDMFCSKRGTCCIDSPYLHLQNQNDTGATGTCLPIFGSRFSAFMVSTCENDWDGDPQTKAMCENQQSSVRDPLSTVPVTNTVSQITYKNYFCALCNYAHKEIVFWNIVLWRRINSSAEILNKTEVYNALVFDEATNKWGIYELNDENKMTFIPMSIKHSISRNFANSIQSCPVGLISSCASNWTEMATKQKCGAYFAEVYFQTSDPTEWYKTYQAYRNIHCAICNYVIDTNENRCYPTIYGGYGVNLQFTLLLDINMSSGQDVGKTNLCRSGQTYDPFFKKCRTLRCAIPGYIIKDKKCVPL